VKVALIGPCRRRAIMNPYDLFMLLGAIVVAVVTVMVVRARQKSHAGEVSDLAGEVVCEHLQSALELLESRGHRATRVGQKHRDLPMEIHLTPPFSPQAVYDELELREPVFVSERNVLYCKQDWCEIHPTA
jgi:hypothetical protein